MPALCFLISILSLSLSAHSDYKISYEGKVKTTRTCNRDFSFCKIADISLSSKKCFIELEMTENHGKKGMDTHYAKRGRAIVPGILNYHLVNREYETDKFYHDAGKTAYLYRGKANEFAAYIEGDDFTTSVLYDNSTKPYPYAVNYIFSLRLRNQGVSIECDGLSPISLN